MNKILRLNVEIDHVKTSLNELALSRMERLALEDKLVALVLKRKEMIEDA